MAIRMRATSACTCDQMQKLPGSEHYYDCPDNEPDLTVEEIRQLRKILAAAQLPPS